MTCPRLSFGTSRTHLQGWYCPKDVLQALKQPVPADSSPTGPGTKEWMWEGFIAVRILTECLLPIPATERANDLKVLVLVPREEMLPQSTEPEFH